MDVEDFRQMYLAELQEACNAEAQLVEALPKMAAAASHEELKHGIESHLQETRSHHDRVENLLRSHGADPSAHKDQSMQAIIGESDKWSKMVPDHGLRDASLIASAQRIEHYEMALYGSLATWAKQLGLSEDEATLHAILEDEKRADQKLSGVA
ncbi:MAG TPA: DUF892 family protein, partial [Pararhizobium sp.]|nr:DUF892 family protein [Pararhizobium sp.]